MFHVIYTVDVFLLALYKEPPFHILPSIDCVVAGRFLFVATRVTTFLRRHRRRAAPTGNEGHHCHPSRILK